jgi:hypothetical protein
MATVGIDGGRVAAYVAVSARPSARLARSWCAVVRVAAHRRGVALLIGGALEAVAFTARGSTAMSICVRRRCIAQGAVGALEAARARCRFAMARRGALLSCATRVGRARGLAQGRCSKRARRLRLFHAKGADRTVAVFFALTDGRRRQGAAGDEPHWRAQRSVLTVTRTATALVGKHAVFVAACLPAATRGSTDVRPAAPAGSALSGAAAVARRIRPAS